MQLQITNICLGLIQRGFGGGECGGWSVVTFFFFFFFFFMEIVDTIVILGYRLYPKYSRHVTLYLILFFNKCILLPMYVCKISG